VAFFQIPGIEIKDVAAAVPTNSVDNMDLECLGYTDRMNFVQKIGIRNRRVAPSNLCASDLCIAATQHLFKLRGYHQDDFGALIFVTQTPDYLLPGNCTFVQNRLGLSNSTYMLDINQGCAGYVYGLATLAGVLYSTGIERGLLLVGDTVTRILAQSDNTTVPIFSDAGSATVLERSANGNVMYFNLGADGTGTNVIRVEHGGSRNPVDKNQGAPYLSMKGIDVLNYSIRHVIPNISQLLDLSGYDKDHVDYFVFHQANRILNECLYKKLGISSEKAPETLGVFGNTSCATIPLTINHCIGKYLETSTVKLVLSGFGVGFSWGSALIELGPVHCPDIVEI